MKRRHCYSYDDIDYEGLEYAVKETEDMPEETKKRVHYAFSKLTDTQKRRLAMYAKGKSIREIAIIEKVHHKAVEDSIEQARKKFLKFF